MDYTKQLIVRLLLITWLVPFFVVDHCKMENIQWKFEFCTFE